MTFKRFAWANYGRNRDSLLIMPGIMPFVGRTQQEAEDRFAHLQSLLDPKVAIGMLVINHFPDLTGCDLDGPVPEVAITNDQMSEGMKTSAREPEFTGALMERARREKLTIRQLFDVISAGFWSLGVIGTPGRIADLMEEWLTAGAADGFIVQPPDLPGAGIDFVELVIPELQRRGLFRRDYEGGTLRENLGLPGYRAVMLRSGRSARDGQDQAQDEPWAVHRQSRLSLCRMAASRRAG